MNPDGHGRPAPILIGLYTLKSTAVFEASDFPSLQDRAKAVLADDLVSFRVHGVTPEFVKEMKVLGDGHIDPDDLVSLKIHGATPDFVRQMESLGYRHLSACKFTNRKPLVKRPSTPRR